MNESTGLVLITGCGSGIGQALARAFHHSGQRVCATARRLETLAPLAAEGLMVRALDVTDAAAVERLLAELAAAGLAVETLVNNAGHGAMGPVLDVPPEAWRRQFEVNLFAPIALVRAVAPGMIRRGRGRVVNISSVSGLLTTPFAGAYGASKAALNAASDALRLELAPLGVRVVTVQPGGIRTGFGDQAAQHTHLAADSPYQPLRERVLSRAQESQVDAMDVDAFAAQLVQRLAAPDCPAVIRLGAKSRLMPALRRWLSQRTLDRILTRRYELERLAPTPR